MVHQGRERMALTKEQGRRPDGQRSRRRGARAYRTRTKCYAGNPAATQRERERGGEREGEKNRAAECSRDGEHNDTPA